MANSSTCSSEISKFVGQLFRNLRRPLIARRNEPCQMQCQHCTQYWQSRRSVPEKRISLLLDRHCVKHDKRAQEISDSKRSLSALESQPEALCRMPWHGYLEWRWLCGSRTTPETLSHVHISRSEAQCRPSSVTSLCLTDILQLDPECMECAVAAGPTSDVCGRGPAVEHPWCPCRGHCRNRQWAPPAFELFPQCPW